jgi:hypothetical protein
MLEAGSLSHPRLLLVAEMPPVTHRPAEDLRRHITFTSSPGIRQALTDDDITQARYHVREVTKVVSMISTRWCCPARAPAADY